MGLNDVKDRIPGVSFSYKRIEVLGTSQRGQRRYKIELFADVNDQALWDSVKEKLKRLKLHSNSNFKDEIIDTLGEELEDNEDQVGVLTDALNNAFTSFCQLAQQYIASDTRRQRLEFLLQDVIEGLGVVLPEEPEYPQQGGHHDNDAKRRPSPGWTGVPDEGSGPERARGLPGQEGR